MKHFRLASEPIVREARNPRFCEGTLRKQAEYDALCAQYPEGIVRLAKFLYANDHLYASNEPKELVFDPSRGMMAHYLKQAERLIAVHNGENVDGFADVYELRWVAPKTEQVPA